MKRLEPQCCPYVHDWNTAVVPRDSPEQQGSMRDTASSSINETSSREVRLMSKFSGGEQSRAGRHELSQCLQHEKLEEIRDMTIDGVNVPTMSRVNVFQASCDSKLKTLLKRSTILSSLEEMVENDYPSPPYECRSEGPLLKTDHFDSPKGEFGSRDTNVHDCRMTLSHTFHACTVPLTAFDQMPERPKIFGFFK
ncbi:unnamed protein product [Nippostrongylus brasiliensis]|uniref:Fibrous sheath-interacting protein 1 n=1 Tax=Nippostrongylus brasiliensis TaxID=27835 RepID=A0A0N4Y6X4_NIPBR|nr:unnamed protein product [Nippostrongylus brasiliensis]